MSKGCQQSSYNPPRTNKVQLRFNLVKILLLELEDLSLLRIYNTLNKKVELFQPRNTGVVRIYTCGPTVYRDAHIGNLRSYLMADWIRRSLTIQGFNVTHVKNITDVGHMRQEQLERGGDKVVLAALAEGKTPKDIADYYTQAFLKDEAKINILPASHFPRATEHIPEIIDIIQELFTKGYAYEVDGSVYFNVPAFDKYGQLSGNIALDQAQTLTLLESDPNKKDPRDFALWKKAEPGRDMKWDSPWGYGFPGWHIECSAMSTRYLGFEQDIHTGGVDNIFPHHEDEVAQSEAAFGTPYVNYWIHGQHLLADGVKMAKSAGNEFTLADLEATGFDPLSFRYLCLTVKYRNRLNFTFSALKASQKALTRLRDLVANWKHTARYDQTDQSLRSAWKTKFWNAANNDLNLAQALGIVWDLASSKLPDASKLNLLLGFDELLGLDLNKYTATKKLPRDIKKKVTMRNDLRANGRFKTSDAIRAELSEGGLIVRDTLTGTFFRSKTVLERQAARWPAVSSSREVDSFLSHHATKSFSLILIATNYYQDVKRCIKSIISSCSAYDLEIIIVDNGSTDGTSEKLDKLQQKHPHIKLIHCDHQLGDAQAKNIGLKQSLGHIILMLDTCVELKGDVLIKIEKQLKDTRVGAIGTWGLLSDNLNHFHEEVDFGEIDALQGYCFAFRRDILLDVGLMRECFRFYRILDIDFSFQIKDKGYKILADGSLPMLRHKHRQWENLLEAERDELSKKNFKRFLVRWKNRTDLLVTRGTRDIYDKLNLNSSNGSNK